MAVSAPRQIIDACSRHHAWGDEERARGMARRHVKNAVDCPKCAAGMKVSAWECEICGLAHWGHRWWT